LKRLASLLPVLISGLLIGCGSMSIEKHGADDFETVRDNLTVQPLKSGEVMTGLSGKRGQEQHFSLLVPAGAKNLRVVQSGGTGDADLYLRFDGDPTSQSWDYRPFIDGNDETVVPDPVKAGTWYFMVRGFAAYSGVSVMAAFDPPPDVTDAGAPPPPPPPPPPDAMPPPPDAMPPPAGPDCQNPASWPAQWVGFEDEVLTLVNEKRAAGATCGATVKPPVPALTMEAHLRQAARCHSLDLGTHNYFSHDSQDGRSPWDRISQAGYTAFGNAENIAAGQSSPASVVDSWMSSPGHCNNVMTSGSNEIGIGFAMVEGSDFGRYWTQDFGKR
jgi:uncharacterized protein YkwD